MSIITRRNILTLALLGLSTLLSPVEAQYYGYRRRNTGWRNIYLVAIIVPVIFIALCALFWICIFRAIFRRRRERRNGGLPTTNNTHNTSTLPSAYGQTYGNNTDNSYAYGQNSYGQNGYGNNYTTYQPPSSPYPVASNNGGEAQNYYNSGNGGAPQYPQQAYGGNQQGYAPPSGPPPKR